MSVVSQWRTYRRAILLGALVAGLLILFALLPEEARTALFKAFRVRGSLVGMILLFAAVSLSLVWSAGQRLDARVFMHFNLGGHRGKGLDRLMWLATQLGSFGAATLLAALLVWARYPRLATETILGTLTLWLVVESVKAVTDRARPFHVLEGTRVLGWRETGRSFPSGHTAQTFFLVALMVHRFHPGVAVVVGLYFVAALVGLTRMYVGAHYPRDVLGGALLGTLWGILASVVDPYGFHHWTR